MIETILLLIACTTCSLIFYNLKRNKISDLKKYIEKSEVDNKLSINNYKKKLKKEFDKKTKAFYKNTLKRLELEYNKACEEVEKELKTTVNELDILVGQQLEEAALKNILTFSCSCSKDLIACPIDFTKENSFVCDKCGSKYKVSITAEPILVGRTITDSEFANLLEKRINE